MTDSNQSGASDVVRARKRPPRAKASAQSGKASEVELSEKELNRVAGGFGTGSGAGKLKFDGA